MLDILGWIAQNQNPSQSMGDCTMNGRAGKHKERIIKVDAAFRTGRFHEYRPYARMRLQGRWLENAGFVSGTRVRIAVTQGQLTISRVEG